MLQKLIIKTINALICQGLLLNLILSDYRYQDTSQTTTYYMTIQKITTK